MQKAKTTQNETQTLQIPTRNAQLTAQVILRGWLNRTRLKHQVFLNGPATQKGPPGRKLTGHRAGRLPDTRPGADGPPKDFLPLDDGREGGTVWLGSLGAAVRATENNEVGFQLVVDCRGDRTIGPGKQRHILGSCAPNCRRIEFDANWLRLLKPGRRDVLKHHGVVELLTPHGGRARAGAGEGHTGNSWKRSAQPASLLQRKGIGSQGHQTV